MQCAFEKINKIQDYFMAEILEREIINKIIIKYISAFEVFHKTWFYLKQVIVFLLHHLLLLLVHQLK